MRLTYALLVMLVLAGGCTAPQAHRLRRQSELAIGGSLVGVMASSLAIAIPGAKPVFIPVAIAFGGLAVASAVVFGVAYAYEEPPAPVPLPPAAPDHRDEAWALTKQAQAAARANDCSTVRTLDAQIAALDASFHAAVFTRDVAIARCLQPSQ